jgi:hypothetical protein
MFSLNEPGYCYADGEIYLCFGFVLLYSYYFLLKKHGLRFSKMKKSRVFISRVLAFKANFHFRFAICLYLVFYIPSGSLFPIFGKNCFASSHTALSQFFMRLV